MRFPRLRYFFHSLQHPSLARLGYARLGMGLEQRHHALCRHWQSYLAQSLEIQRKWFNSTSAPSSWKNGTLLIIGAGRLYDCRVSELALKFKRLHLVDADPTCLSQWQREKRRSESSLSWSISEISGMHQDCLKTYVTGLRNLARSERAWSGVLKGLEELPFPKTSKLSFLARLGLDHPPEAVLSLNLLSQMPLALKDSLSRALVRHFGRNFVDARTDEFLQAFNTLAKRILIRHFEELSSLGASSILLISDVEELTYSVKVDLEQNTQAESPFEWKEGHWTPRANYLQEQVVCESRDATWGIRLEEDSFRKKLLTSYNSQVLGSLLWHINPQGVERNDLGTINRLLVIRFDKK